MATRSRRSRPGLHWLATLPFLLLLQPLASASAQAPPSPDTLTAGVIGDWPPYYVIDASGEPSGFAVETFRAVARRAGFEPRLRVYGSFAAVQRALQEGEVDVVPSMGEVEGRDFLFTLPIDAFSVAFFVRASAVDVTASGGIEGPVAVVATNIGVKLAATRPELDPVVFPEVREALFRLLAGNVDALLYPVPVLRALAEEAGVADKIAMVDPPIAEVKRPLALAPGDTALQARLNDAIREYVGSSEYEEAFSRWHAPPRPFWTVGRVVRLGIGVLILLALAAGVWRYLTLRRFAKALRARERTFRALAGGLSECVFLVGEKDRVVHYANDRCTKLLGLDSQALLGKDVATWLPPEVLHDRAPPGPIELERADGSTMLADVSVGPPLEGTEPPSYLVTIADVTERLSVERRLSFQARLLDLIGEAVIATDLHGVVTFWNRFAVTLYGWTKAEAVGRPVAELTTPAASARQADEIMDTVRSGSTWAGQFNVARRDGSTFPAYVTNAPILDEDGAVVGIVGVSADLTKQKELEGMLQQAQKLEAIGRLAGGVAHDFNNLLTAIQGHIDLALSEVEEGSGMANDLAEARHASGRAAELTRQLLAFGRRQPLRPVVLDLCAVARDVERMLGRLIGENVALRVHCGESLWKVEADRVQMEQVLMNLAINARDAMPSGGELIIGLANRHEHALDQRRPGAAPADGASEWVELTVSDTGEGIPEADLDKIFEPFFTTKGPGKGTGLGLSTVHGVVTQSGGRVEVESEPGQRTTFRILLPRTSKSPTPTAAPDVASEDGDTAHATILLVEDDDAVRQVVRKILTRAGHSVDDFASPFEALASVDPAHPHDLLVTDIVMPELTGPELAVRVKALSLDIGVIFTSGYSSDHLRDVAHAVGSGASILPKPFTPAALKRAVREALEGRANGS